MASICLAYVMYAAHMPHILLRDDATWHARHTKCMSSIHRNVWRAYASHILCKLRICLAFCCGMMRHDMRGIQNVCPVYIAPYAAHIARIYLAYAMYAAHIARILLRDDATWHALHTKCRSWFFRQISAHIIPHHFAAGWLYRGVSRVLYCTTGDQFGSACFDTKFG